MGNIHLCSIHVSVCIYSWIHLPRTQLTPALEDLSHKMESQSSKKDVSLALGILYIIINQLS